MSSNAPVDLANLQNALGLVDRPVRHSAGLFEQLLVKKDFLKFKMYQEKGHRRPHFHIDYGPHKHAASFAIDTGARLDGSLDKKYDSTVSSWISANRNQLLQIWSAMQAGDDEQPYIQSLSAIDA